MYNFNTSLSTPPLLGLDFGSNTPRTPEILNSLIAMTNPFEYSSYTSVTSHAPAIPSSIDVSPVIACKTESFLHQYDNNSSSSSSVESPSETPLHMAASISSTPSLQQVR
jgi:activating transcription factor 3